MYILGISAFYHDSSACLIKNSEILTAVRRRDLQEKNLMLLSRNSILFCLKENNLELSDISFVVL